MFGYMTEIDKVEEDEELQQDIEAEGRNKKQILTPLKYLKLIKRCTLDDFYLIQLF